MTETDKKGIIYGVHMEQTGKGFVSPPLWGLNGKDKIIIGFVSPPLWGLNRLKKEKSKDAQ